MKRKPSTRDRVTFRLNHVSGDDADLDIECSLLGTLMLQPEYVCAPLATIPPYAFQESFHAAIYYSILSLLMRGKNCDPQAVWWLVADHPDADQFGFEHLVDLATDAADPEHFIEHSRRLFMRGMMVMSNELHRVWPLAEDGAAH